VSVTTCHIRFTMCH
ncbi:hypothetical protein SAMD00019534_125840, partial [Acytostelium subglobosum LB1]